MTLQHFLLHSSTLEIVLRYNACVQRQAGQRFNACVQKQFRPRMVRAPLPHMQVHVHSCVTSQHAKFACLPHTMVHGAHTFLHPTVAQHARNIQLPLVRGVLLEPVRAHDSAELCCVAVLAARHRGVLREVHIAPSSDERQCRLKSQVIVICSTTARR